MRFWFIWLFSETFPHARRTPCKYSTKFSCTEGILNGYLDWHIKYPKQNTLRLEDFLFHELETREACLGIRSVAHSQGEVPLEDFAYFLHTNIPCLKQFRAHPGPELQNDLILLNSFFFFFNYFSFSQAQEVFDFNMLFNTLCFSFSHLENTLVNIQTYCKDLKFGVCIHISTGVMNYVYLKPI